MHKLLIVKLQVKYMLVEACQCCLSCGPLPLAKEKKNKEILTIFSRSLDYLLSITHYMINS